MSRTAARQADWHGTPLTIEVHAAAVCPSAAAYTHAMSRQTVRLLATVPIAAATVVTLFLVPEPNARLRPKLRRQLRPGSQIVSHRHGIGDWSPDRMVTLSVRGTRNRIFLWRVT
jgi:hypothetical protein